MRKFLLTLVFLLFSFFAYAQDIPRPQGWVNDFANVISPDYKDKLNALIGSLEQKSSAEIAVVTINSIAPYDEKDYARKLFDNWKPGKKGKDNGVLVLVAIKERRWRIETGYGVEGILPDGLCGEIGRNYMVPYFKAGKYAEGLYSGVAAIASVIAKDAVIQIEQVSDMRQAAANIKIPAWKIKLLIVAAILIILQHWGLILLGVFFLISVLGLKIWVIFLVGVLLFLRLLFWQAATGHKSSYHGTYWGGGFGGGGFGGGGFGGGGFGGGGGGGGGSGGGF